MIRPKLLPPVLVLLTPHAIAVPPGQGEASGPEEIRTDDEVESESEKLPEGHSHAGAAFNEGPRQAAYLMPNNGSVYFPITTEDGYTQRMFDQGVGQLHGFWYFEAERSFRQVAALDPDCATAYWGMAMANVENEERAAGFARESWLRRDNVSERERMYVDSLARFYDVDFEEPQGKDGDKKDGDKKDGDKKDGDKKDGDKKDGDKKDGDKKDGDKKDGDKKDGDKKDGDKKDGDKKDGDKEDGDKKDGDKKDGDKKDGDKEDGDKEAKKQAKERKRKPADEKTRRKRYVKDLETIIFEYPDDIEAKALLVNHLWLNGRHGLPIVSKQANQALIDQVLASRPDHPVHHYRIHLWDAKDTAQYVVDSAVKSGPSWPTVAHQWHMGGHIFDRLGRHADAAWQQEASARVDHAHMMRDLVLPDQIHNFAHNDEWLVRSLRQCGRVRDAVDLARNMVELPRHPQWNRLDKGGCSASYGRRRLFGTLQQFELWDELIETCGTMYLEPSEKAGDEALRAFLLGEAHAFLGDEDGRAAQVERLRDLLAREKLARVESLEAAEDEALEEDKKSKDVREAMAKALEGHASTLKDLRGRIATLEALADVLAGRDVEDALERLDDEHFDDRHLARLHAEVGDPEKAEKLARKAAKDKTGRAYPMANLAYVLDRVGKREEALVTFRSLRAFSARFDLDAPVFRRLRDLAEEEGHGPDWRVPEVTPEDVADRRDLATLGPARWSPPASPEWRAVDETGAELSLADYEGKPHLLILFLGFGCVHCIEQLEAFSPAQEGFEAAGIEIVTIGTDPKGKLVESLADLDEEERYPFPVLADPQHENFHALRAFDDFENQPLHGTYLIDAAGRIRWQDISYEPFVDHEFLLAESKRLLGLPDAGAGRAATASSPGGGASSSSGGGR